MVVTKRFPASERRRPRRRLALVLQGGGALGAYQGGVYEALTEHGFAPDWAAASEGDFWPVPPDSDADGHAVGSWSVLRAIVLGQPGFFAPRWFNPSAILPTGTAETASFYDTRPLRETLERLSDFELLNSGATRLSVGAVNVVTGALRHFDRKGDRLGPEHIMASGARFAPSMPCCRRT